MRLKESDGSLSKNKNNANTIKRREFSLLKNQINNKSETK